MCIVEFLNLVQTRVFITKSNTEAPTLNLTSVAQKQIVLNQLCTIVTIPLEIVLDYFNFC